jgi:hypothetical protein
LDWAVDPVKTLDLLFSRSFRTHIVEFGDVGKVQLGKDCKKQDFLFSGKFGDKGQRLT